MKSRVTTVVLASALGIGGLAAGAVLVPSLAAAATSDTTSPDTTSSGPTAADALGDRAERIGEILAGLVSEGTITQDQADAVASALAESLPAPGGPGGADRMGGRGPGGPGPGLSVAAETLGMTEDEVRSALADGASLASLAEQEGVPVDTLVDALVAEAQTHLAEHVADGDLTQAEADDRLAEVTTRIEEMVRTEGLPQPGPRHGDGRGDGTGSGSGTGDGTTTGSATPSPTSST